MRDPLVRVLHVVWPLHAVPHIEHPRALQRVASGLVYVEQQVAIRGTDLRVAQALVGFEHDLRFLLAGIEDHQRINLVFQLHRAGHAAVIRDGEMPLQRRPRREAAQRRHRAAFHIDAENGSIVLGDHAVVFLPMHGERAIMRVRQAHNLARGAICPVQLRPVLRRLGRFGALKEKIAVVRGEVLRGKIQFCVPGGIRGILANLVSCPRVAIRLHSSLQNLLFIQEGPPEKPLSSGPSCMGIKP